MGNTNRAKEIEETIEMYKRLLLDCPEDDKEFILDQIDYWESILDSITGRGV
jgi:hypothetical protein